ncbi:hypothetical protein PIB30_033793 [Stylosanthes scabra]|uniref:Uncharacterized protein n=1 Tax=Stylosanthes scabra TaxID=79078 RepID=A0ABU6WAL9_9FABA|nr:hypothetical protein [Stylosanthes scabra]
MVVIRKNVHKDKHLRMVDKKVVAQNVMIQEAHMVGDKVDMNLDPMEVFVSDRVWFECIVVEKNVEGKVHMDMVVGKVHNQNKHHHIHWISMHHNGDHRVDKVEGSMKQVLDQRSKPPPSIDYPPHGARYH